MTGVEILVTKTIYASILPEWCLALSIMLFSFFVVCFLASISNLNYAFSIISCIFLIGSIIFLIMTQIGSKTDIDYIEYKVTISDEVSMNKFYEKYEVLDQEGKIYTVRERE